jgi:hypothetical protein
MEWGLIETVVADRYPGTMLGFLDLENHFLGRLGKVQEPEFMNKPRARHDLQDTSLDEDALSVRR